MFPVAFGDPAGAMPGDEKARWKWLWSNVRFDSEDLADILRIDSLKVGKLVNRAAAFRLIYPDGTSSALALQFVRNEIQKAVSKRAGRPRNEEAEDRKEK